MSRSIQHIALLAILLLLLWVLIPKQQAPIRVGVLHSLSGVMAESERPVADVTLLAIEEINRKGGIKGRPVEAVLIDGQSDWGHFADEAERLIEEEEVVTLFGCWTSACRKALRSVVERHDHLLVYPLQYEGMEQSDHILYTGAVPNQQILPALRWATRNLGKRFYLLGSDDVFSHAAHEISRDWLRRMDAHMVGESMVPLYDRGQWPELDRVVTDIVHLQPDVVINTVSGAANRPLFEKLHVVRRAGQLSQSQVISFSVTETEVEQIGVEVLQGSYAAWNYFQSLELPQNRDFVERVQQQMGEQQPVGSPMAAAWSGVHLWAQAAESVLLEGELSPAAIRALIRDQSYAGPQGIVAVDGENNHLWQRSMIGRVNAQGQFDIVEQSERLEPPNPWPTTRSRSGWLSYLGRLHRRWGEAWEAPRGGE